MSHWRGAKASVKAVQEGGFKAKRVDKLSMELCDCRTMFWRGHA